jgi:hypothetical protein
MGIWDSIKGGVGAAWDNTGGAVYDAHQQANEDGRIFGLNPDKSLYQELDAVADFGEWAGNTGFDFSIPGIAYNTGNYLRDQWTPTQQPPAGYTAENFDRPLRNAETDTRIRFGGVDTSPEAFDALLAGGAPPNFTRPDFDPTAITGPYGDYTTAANEAFDQYTSMLEGISTGPRTSRIEEMYGLATDEARRRMESADTYEATAGARLEADTAAMGERLEGLHTEFNDELALIREASSDRREGDKAEREARIDAAAAELGDAAATFLVSSTKTSDILDSQGSRQEVYDGRMDRLYAGAELDRTMAAAGLATSERRELADDVMAMREMIHQFSYDAGQERLGRLFVAEEGAAQRETDMLTTLAELGYGHAGQMADVGLQQGLAVAGAEDAFNSQWDEVEAYLGNPVTANAFFGMDPSMLGGVDPSEFVDYWLAIQQMQAGAAGDDIGPLVVDPVYGAPWSGGYVIDPATGQEVFDPSGMGAIADAVGMTSGDLVSNIYTPPGR